MGLNRSKAPKWKRYPKHFFQGSNGRKFKGLHTMDAFLRHKINTDKAQEAEVEVVEAD